MILKDFYCIACRSTVADVEVVSASVCVLTMECSICGAQTHHLAQCNGGLGKRFRMHDWDVREVRKGITYTGGGACYGDDRTGEPDKSNPVVDNATGEIYQDAPRFSADARDERRAREWHRRDSRDGRGKIIDTRRATSARRTETA